MLVGMANAHMVELASVFDDPGRSHVAGNVGDAAHGLLGTDDRRKALDTVDTVLKGDEPCVGANQRQGCFRRLLGVP